MIRKNIFTIARNLYRERAVWKRNKTEKVSSRNLSIKLKEEGVLILDKFYSDDFCYNIIKSIDEYLRKHKDDETLIIKKIQSENKKSGIQMNDGTNYWIDILRSDRRILYSEKINKNINLFSRNEILFEFGELLLGYKMNLQYTMANNTIFTEENLGSGGGWHRDNNYRHGFKALMYLNDVDDNNGPFEYLKGTFSLKSHLLDFPFLDKYQYTDEEIEKFILKNPQRYIRIKARAGTVVVFNTNGIHRGMPIKQGNRYAITNYYV